MIEKGMEVTVFFTGGVKVSGIVLEYNEEYLALSCNQKPTVIFQPHTNVMMIQVDTFSGQRLEAKAVEIQAPSRPMTSVERAKKLASQHANKVQGVRQDVSEQLKTSVRGPTVTYHNPFLGSE